MLFIILFFLMRSSWVRARSGIVSGAFLAGYGIFRSFIELFREPDAHIGLISGISRGQMLSAPMIAAGLCLIIYAIVRHKNHERAA